MPTPDVRRPNRDLYLEGEERRRQALTMASEGLRVPEICERLGITMQTFRQWRSRDQFFNAELTSRLSGARVFKTEDPTESWENFPDFRKRFFKHETPPHQAMMINAWEATAPGDITLTLIFPESGKTTLAEDYFCKKLGTDPEYRITVGCEAQSLSRRILGRVKNRMDPYGPFKDYVHHFGPFIPEQASGRASQQVWAADFFNVNKRMSYDERDYSMQGIGFGSNIIGSRTDHLHCDDLQSAKNLNRTEDMMRVFQQDWLTRPGEHGIVTINGTRAGDGDFYEALISEFEGESWFRVVKLPAVVTDQITGEKVPLWPYDPESKARNKGYTMEQLDKIRRKVGEDVWSRSYMQDPRSSGLGTFTEDIVDRCLNYERPLYTDDLPGGPGSPIYIGLDPALGGVNCIMALQITPDKLFIVDLQEDIQLSRNEDIMIRLEMVLLRLQARGGRVTDVVVEANNFQRGLARDERFKDLSDKYGFAMREHLTNISKYDEDIGVASMVSTFIKKEIDIPYAADDKTRAMADQYRHQLLRWRPGIKGNILRQDQVMATWFPWIVWQQRRRTHPISGASFNSGGLPWKPTNSGLLVPTTGSPLFGG
jgi:hypothetical protein